jgi:glutathione S-transferase
MELPNGETLSESNAILNYLCEGSTFYPADIWTRAKIHQWQFFEQYSHEPYIAVARFINKYLGLPEDRKQDYLAKQEGGKKALTVMEQQLGKSSFLTGDFPSAADISLFAYTHVANEGGFNLRDYPNIQTWIKRMQNLRNFVSM